MSEPAIIIRLDGNGCVYHPGETLSGEYRLESMADEELTAVEVSVLWYTEGKGDEDLAVHEFWRRDATGGDLVDPRRPERFSTTLPPSPLSYDGQIVKVRWCVRVRAYLARGKELVGQRVFRLGCVPPIRSALASKGGVKRVPRSVREGWVEPREEARTDSQSPSDPKPALPPGANAP